jgi:hypothetical protein
VRKYRHKIKQCYPDRLGGLAPELLQLAEEQAKALNGAYANAMRARRYAPRDGAAACGAMAAPNMRSPAYMMGGTARPVWLKCNVILKYSIT